MATDPTNKKFIPVQWSDKRDPYYDPQFLPPDPHNIPNRADLLRRGGPEYLGGDGLPTEDPVGGWTGTIRDPHHYATLISLYSAVPDDSAAEQSILILPQSNVKRNWLSIRNPSVAANLWVNFGAAASAQSWLILAPGEIVLFDTVVPQNDMWVLASATAGFISFAWSTIAG